jgi:hypothetical protein
MLVKSELEKVGLHYGSVELCEAEIIEDISPEQRENLSIALEKTGLEVMQDKKSILVERIKAVIIDLVHNTDEQIKINLSTHLSEKLNHNYTYLGNLFSEVKGLPLRSLHAQN